MSFFSRVSKAFRFGKARFLMGKDLDNNNYFEYPPLDGSLDPRKTRRVIQYRIFKELGEHDQASLPAQWLMWLRHTRKSAPTIEELVQDKERIETVRHNARVLEQRDAERRLQLEQQASEDAQKIRQQQQLLESKSAGPSSSSVPRTDRATPVPTSAVNNEGDAKSQEQRHVDMEVWEASRRRVEVKNAQKNDAFTRRADRRAELNQADTERERARRAMNRSPLEAFDVSYEDDILSQPKEQLKARFGRSVGAGEEWSPQSWSPPPTSHR